MNEYSKEAGGDGDALYYMYSMCFVVRCLFSIATLYLISYFMESGKSSIT